MTNQINGNYTEEYGKAECTIEKVKKNSTKKEKTDTVKDKDAQADKVSGEKDKKEPTQKQIKSALEQANQKAKMTKTACEFSYDDNTNRISITVKDKETDEIIREIPGEETLEMISKIWELAGILVDEKL